MADKAKVSRTSVVVLEAGERHQSHWIVDAIQNVLEHGGANFGGEDVESLNVQLKSSK
jgi:hypothetical protein